MDRVRVTDRVRVRNSPRPRLLGVPGIGLGQAHSGLRVRVGRG